MNLQQMSDDIFADISEQRDAARAELIRQVEANEQLRRENAEQLDEIRSTNGELDVLEKQHAALPGLVREIYEYGKAIGENEVDNRGIYDCAEYAELQALLGTPAEAGQEDV